MYVTIMKLQARRHRLLSTFGYHTYTLWLFTVNDLKTMVFPSTAFAFANCGHMEATSEFLSRLPHVLFWTWVNLLAFAVNNQRNPSAITEDRLNKPWRPIPSGRLSADNARKLGIFAYVLAQVASLLAGGGIVQSTLLSVLGYVYNELGGGDSGYVVRNTLNAAGFTSFASGALEVASGGISVITVKPILAWLALIAATVATTVHSQDMYDQEGDAAAGRRTVPLVIGDKPARWSIATAVAWWSFICPLYWWSGLAGYILVGTLGAWVAWRTMYKTSVPEDRVTFRIYNAWLVSMYSLPLVAQIESRGLLV